MGFGGATLAALVGAPFVLAAAYPALGRVALVRRIAWAPALLLACVELAAFVAIWGSPGEAAFSLPWIAPLGIDFALRLDGLAFLFAILVSGIGAAILAFSARYLPHHFHAHQETRHATTFYAYVLFFMGSMLGVACADELITLYLFWEATSVSSFLLIAIHLREEASREGAIKAFLITASAGLALFVAFLAMAEAGGTTSLAGLRPNEIRDSPLSVLILGGVVVGAAAKSAQVPFHSWLPDAMVAPTPVSAYLHSATMVAAGVFLLARLAPVLEGIAGYQGTLVLIGTSTMLAGGLVALVQTRLKGILAWSTISQYGYITLLLGLGAWGPAVFLIGNHAILKAGLFLSAGLVTYATGEDDVRRLGGLARTHPATAVITGVLALGLAGVPATSGFWMKELLYKSVVAEQLPWLELASITAGVLTLVYMLRYWWRIFFSRGGAAGVEREGVLVPMLAPTGGLALLVLVIGIAPSAAAALTDLGAAQAAGGPVDTAVTLTWPPDRALWLSLLTFALGGVTFGWVNARQGPLPHGDFPPLERPAVAPAALFAAVARQLGPRRLYLRSIRAPEDLGRYLARMQTGRLLHYLLFLAAVPVIAAIVLLPQVERWPPLVAPTELGQSGASFAALALAAIGLAAGSAAVRSNVGSILMVGGVGFVLALIFSILRAPDVALVQVAVETVTALLLLVALTRIHISERERALAMQTQSSLGGRIAAIGISTALGATVAVLTLAVSGGIGPSDLGRGYFALSESLGVEAVVTAILVDFRGLDTLGEITVFAAAVLGTALVVGRWGGTWSVKDE